MSPQSKYWGDVSPLSHRDRRPCRACMLRRTREARVDRRCCCSTAESRWSVFAHVRQSDRRTETDSCAVRPGMTWDRAVTLWHQTCDLPYSLSDLRNLSTDHHGSISLCGAVVSVLGMRTRRPRFESRVASLFNWVATLGKLFTHTASPVSQLQETGVQKGVFGA